MTVVPVFEAQRQTDETGNDVLVVNGDVDLATAQQFVAAAQAWATSGTQGPVRLDLRGVTFLDSTGISALLEIRRTAAESGTAVVVVGQSAAVDRVLAVAGIADLFADPAREA
jgi:anti-sigma B factor antagonist